MKRVFWLGIGLAVGALVVRKMTRTAHSYTPAGIASSLSESAGSLVETVRSFVADVREGMAEREQQIHQAFADGVMYDDQFAELRAAPHLGDHEIFLEEGRR